MLQLTRPTIQALRRLPMRRMLFASPLVVIAMGAALMGARARVPDNLIVTGVHVADLDLGGKTANEAKPLLEQWAARRTGVSIRLRFPADSGITRTWSPTASKLGLGINVDGTLDAAMHAGREDFAGQVSHVFTGRKPIAIAPISNVDDPKLLAYLKRQIAADVNRKPKNAKFVLLRGGGFGTHHEINGLGADIDASAQAIKQTWSHYNADAATTARTPEATTAESSALPETPRSGDATTSTGDASAEPASAGLEAVLAARVTPAALTAADLDQINSVLGAKSSYVNGTPSRLNNIRLAAARINGTLLKPGDVFSYNEIVGPRDEDAGYREAPILVKGRHDKGIAGGICQTSGTLFNAVLHSGLRIVQREHHSVPIGYLPIGLDATVSYGSLDFKFKNDTEAPVYVAATLSGRELTFTLFGKEMPGRQIALVRGAYSRTGASYTTQTDRTKPAGYRRVVEPGSGGCRVTWYRIIKENGKVVHRDVISSSYSAHSGVMVVGTGARRTRPAPGPARKGASGSSAPGVAPGTGGPAPPTPPAGAPQL